jgi:hypothetical protein
MHDVHSTSNLITTRYSARISKRIPYLVHKIQRKLILLSTKIRTLLQRREYWKECHWKSVLTRCLVKCAIIQKTDTEKTVLSDIIIQGAIVRAISCEKIGCGVRRTFISSCRVRASRFNWSIMESIGVLSARNGVIFALPTEDGCGSSLVWGANGEFIRRRVGRLSDDRLLFVLRLLSCL